MPTYAIYDVVEKKFVRDLRWQHFGHDMDWTDNPLGATSNENKRRMLDEHREMVDTFKVSIMLLDRGTWDWRVKGSDDIRSITSAEECKRRKNAGIPNLGLELAEITVVDGVATYTVIYVCWYHRFFG